MRMDFLLENAPFLANYGPLVAAVVLGYTLGIFFNKPDSEHGKKLPTHSQSSTKQSRNVSAEVTSSQKSRVSVDAKVTTEPLDEDDFVLLEDTVSSQSQVFSSTDAEECDGDYQDEFSEDDHRHVPFNHIRHTDDVMIQRSREFYEEMNRRRSMRFFSEEIVPIEIIENIVKTAGTSPSGAHTEPWSFVVVTNRQIKAKIREIIEDEEMVNYHRRMGDNWVNDLKKLNTNWEKPYLEVAPYLIVVFKQSYGVTPSGRKTTHYYSEISIAIAAGLMIAAIQNAGLVTLTSTPMNAGPRLRTLLNRPMNEKVILLLPVGYPSEDATVPDLHRKKLEEIMFNVE